MCSFSTRIMKARMKVTILVMMTGGELIEKPYKIQRKMPAQNSENIPVDRSFVERVFQVLITCGRKDTVVRVPAAMPRSVTVSMISIVSLNLCSTLRRCRSAINHDIPFRVMRQ